MKLTIEGTKDEVAALVRELYGNKTPPSSDGHKKFSLPTPIPVPRANPADTSTSGVSTSGVSTMSTSGGPVDPVVVAMNTIAEAAHREPFSGVRSTPKEAR